MIQENMTVITCDNDGCDNEERFAYGEAAFFTVSKGYCLDLAFCHINCMVAYAQGRLGHEQGWTDKLNPASYSSPARRVARSRAIRGTEEEQDAA